MLNILIVDGNPDTGRLQFKVNGQHSPNGNGRAKPKWGVHWNVRPNTDVLSIVDIEMKAGRDIFLNDPPTAQGGSEGKHWKGTVDKDAPVYAEYEYTIHWMDAAGHPQKHDPKISVDPAIHNSKTLAIGVILSVLGLLSLGLLRWRRNR